MTFRLNDPNFEEDIIELLNRSISERDGAVQLSDNSEDLDSECISVRSLGAISEANDDVSGIEVLHGIEHYDGDNMDVHFEQSSFRASTPDFVNKCYKNDEVYDRPGPSGNSLTQKMEECNKPKKLNLEHGQNVSIVGYGRPTTMSDYKNESNNEFEDRPMHSNQDVTQKRKDCDKPKENNMSMPNAPNVSSVHSDAPIPMSGDEEEPIDETEDRPRGQKKRKKKNSKKSEGQKKKKKSGKEQRLEWDSEWAHVTHNDPGPVSNISVQNIEQGVNLPSHFDLKTKPIDYFFLFFNEEILNRICDETNLFANERKHNSESPRSRLRKWSDITPQELKAFFGIILNMGLHPQPDLTDYFSTKWVNYMPFFADVIDRDRFLLIFWNLHFSHEEGTDRDLKIRFLVNHMQDMCQTFYYPSSNVSVDESTISFKGKIKFKVYNPDKPTKFGLKVYVISDSENGFIYNFSPYYGKVEEENPDAGNPDTELLKTTQTVVRLCDSLVKDPTNPPTGHHVFVDRYYNNPQLAEELLKRKMFLTVTVMVNRKKMPILSKTLETGEIEGRRQKDMGVVYWKDRRVITMITTKHKVGKNNMVEVPSKNPTTPFVRKPEAVAEYTKRMGGVDRADHFIANYQFMRRTKKWYRKLFFWLLEVAVVDAYLLYKFYQESNNKSPVTHKMFRHSLIEDLVRDHIQSKKRDRRKPGRPHQGNIQRLDGKQHFISRLEKRASRCVVCNKNRLRKETVYFCQTCEGNPHLHPDKCFEAFHTKLDF